MSTDEIDALRYRWLREQIKSERTRVLAQALLWNYNSRTELDAAIDLAISVSFTAVEDQS